MDQQAVERMKASHHIALEAWRESLVGNSMDQAAYRHLGSIEANLQRAGVYVIYGEDGVTYEGGES